MPGVAAVSTGAYTTSEQAEKDFRRIDGCLSERLEELKGLAMVVWCDDADFAAANLRNYLWVTYTRANPATDIHGVAAFVRNKHWGCEGPMVVDARIKPHHAPVLVKDPDVEKRIDRLFAKGGSLHGIG
jgi:4-hydroxy-3-polyprenylbenzoate decarboxylase